MKILLDKSRSSARIAWLLLFLLLMPAMSPLGFLVDVPTAYAAGCSGANCGTGATGVASAAGGLGSLLGGGGSSSMMMFMMLAMMLMQMFQGLGGSTPQTGTAEENPSQQGTVGPTDTGDNSDSDNNNNSSSSSNGLASQSLFLAGSGSDQVLAPTTLTVSKGNGFNFFNTTDTDQEVRIYINGTTDLQVDRAVVAGGVDVFNFQNVGTYEVCLVNDGTESCPTTVTVQ